MDFYRVDTYEKGGALHIHPSFLVRRSRDLMTRGGAFYAIWDREAGLWSTDEYDVVRLVDADIQQEAQRQRDRGANVVVHLLEDPNIWMKYRQLVRNTSDNYVPLDRKLAFADDKIEKTDYVSRRLPYSLNDGDYGAWDELIGVLYSEEERRKIEWAIGAIVAGDSRYIQKFMVLYGPSGTGKSTILGIIANLFGPYCTAFDAKALGTANASFAMEAFRSNPLVAIQHDGDLSRIDDNTRLNSIVSHESMVMNEKFRSTYPIEINAFLFVGTNSPVKITDRKSGIIRRLIDVSPSGEKVARHRYRILMGRIEFQLGAIAHHCLQVYEELGEGYYDGYVPESMIAQTDPFYNFIEAHYDIFKTENGTSLKRAYELYKTYCENSGMRFLPQYKIREELSHYFERFHERIMVDGVAHRNYYQGFKFGVTQPEDELLPPKERLTLGCDTSLLDDILADYPAQYSYKGGPRNEWADVVTVLGDIDTSREHFVRVPENLIIVDLDIRVGDEKSLDANLEYAVKFPPTYAEVSRSGKAVHLHYWYEGDLELLAPLYDTGVEVKVYSGKASLRRKVIDCNNIPIATIGEGVLPKREKKPDVIPDRRIRSEKSLRSLVDRILGKEIHASTKPSVDFLKKVLDDAYASGYPYDLTDIRANVIAFAARSTNQSLECLKLVRTMKFISEVPPQEENETVVANDTRLVFFDVEVYPNLFVICWNYEDSDIVVRMINPTPEQVGELFSLRLVGFNVRKYDNHILWARYMGESIEDLYVRSQRIIEGHRDAYFGQAYGLSYADIYDFSTEKKSLKKFQIELGLNHVEMHIPWDQPVPDEMIPFVVDYCANDVLTCKAVFFSRSGDWAARSVLAHLSGLTMNDTTQRHTARILFGDDREPFKKFVYTDLSTIFPGYEHSFGKSSYRGEDPGQGGYIYAEPGYYENVALLDVASMHPTSIVALNYFGPYTARFKELLDARLLVKHGELDEAAKVLDGELAAYLDDPKGLAQALKIAINIVYGLTAASFPNPFKLDANVDNIVAKRGALFMIDLKLAMQERGCKVVHIKTDSIKIAGADQEDIQFVVDFGKRYGYEFELEAVYEQFTLLNDAVYVGRKGDQYTTVGAQFKHPYVYKTLFSGDDVSFDDLCETKSVSKGAIYIALPDSSNVGLGNQPRFVGRVGSFVPVNPGFDGGSLLNLVGDDVLRHVTGTKGYLWHEATVARELGDDCVDMRYFHELAQDARNAIAKFVDPGKVTR